MKMVNFDPMRYLHLREAIRTLRAKPGQRLCFHRSVAMIMDMPASSLIVCTLPAATVEQQRTVPGASTQPFLHAIVDIGGGKVVSPAAFEAYGGKLLWHDRNEYLEFQRATDVQRFARKTVMDFARDIGFAAHLRTSCRRPLGGDRPFVAVLLDRLGVPWRDDDAGGVLPALKLAA